jgi:aryl carrier-like protein
VVKVMLQPPVISPISNQFTIEDTPAGPIAFTVVDAETPSASLTVTASSSNQTLVPDSNLVLAGSDSTRTITITPALHQAGDVNITVAAMDLNGAGAGQTFLLRINPGNHAPVADAQSISMLKNGTQPVILTASDSDGNPLSYSIIASPLQGILSGTPPSLSYKANSNATGSDSFQFKVNDGSLDSVPAMISITINEPAPIRFTAFSIAGGQFNITLSAAVGFNYVIESSTDLKTWAPAIALANPTGTITYFDAIAAQPALFYRAKSVP